MSGQALQLQELCPVHCRRWRDSDHIERQQTVTIASGNL
jgi:hypothetical protein